MEVDKLLLPKEVKRRIKAQKKVQNEIINIEAEFYKEVHALDLKYAPKFSNIFEKRKDILNAKREPTDEECDWPSDEEDEDKDEEAKLAGELKDKAAVEKKKEAGGDAEKKQEEVKGIPSFWLSVFKNVDMLSDMIQDHDEPILTHLQDVQVKVHDKGFTIEFHFEPNEYFTDTVLTKCYEMRYKPDPYDPLSYDGPEIFCFTGCIINWNTGKNVTVKQIKKQPKHKGRLSKTVAKLVKADSFFNFFNPPKLPEEFESEKDKEIESLLWADFEIGHYIRERIVPRAVLYFTGQALKNDDKTGAPISSYKLDKVVKVKLCTAPTRSSKLYDDLKTQAKEQDSIYVNAPVIQCKRPADCSIMDGELKKQRMNFPYNAEFKNQEQAIAQDLSVQSLAFIMVDSEKKSRLLMETEALIKPFIDNVKNKKFRYNIQRIVNTAINAISGLSGAHVTNKIWKLKELLHGQKLKEFLHEHNTNEQGNILPPSVAQDALLFCQNLVAKMLVKQGQEQVTSNHESAFPIGIVVMALWVEFPVMGELFQAHLQALCPYVLPKYSTQLEGQSNIDYHRSLGYKVSENGVIEEQDMFLRRMSGLMRLYCACIVAPLPPDVNTVHPHGLEHAWMWLARTMNLEPHPDVTAAMIFDLLSVTGNFLLKEYRLQFVKLLHLLYRSYLPKLESASVTSGTVGRLKFFLEMVMQNSSIPEPDGLLLRDFFKPPDPDPRS